MALSLAFTAAGAAAAQDRSLPIGSACARTTGFSLIETEDAGRGWTRAFVVETLFEGSDIGDYRIWDVHCRDALLVEAAPAPHRRRAADLEDARLVAADLPVGKGAVPEFGCVPDRKLGVTIRAICDRHVSALKTGDSK